MTTFEEHEGTSVIRRPSEYAPPRSWRTWLIGRPLHTADAPHQTIGKSIGLSVFSADAISSTAYSTQEVLTILALAGVATFSLTFPISIAIVVLLAIVTISYEQTIHAYPNGGGAYIVSRDNLGEMPALAAGAALLTDYILTVAVSISSGIAQVVSALPALYDFRVGLAVGCVLLVTVINLRGVKESGRAFAAPTYFFIVMMALTIVVGLARFVMGTLGQVSDPPEMHMVGASQALTAFLVLRAFASGTSALTGVEAISNGIPAFREPKSHNAGITLIWMSCILGMFVLGVSFLAVHVGAVPSEYETVISQIARVAYNGRGILYLATIAGTTVILIMAANTSFADFPRLGALQAADGFLPRQLAYRGSRLVYSRGIVSLAVIASLLIVAFQASVTALIPLYAIGVFLSFTLSQAGMARRWRRSGRLAPGEELVGRGNVLLYDPRWRAKMVVNGFGAACTAVVAVVFAVTKFHDGAWIVVVLLPLMGVTFALIHRHYQRLARQLSLESFHEPPAPARHRVIVPIGGVHRGTLAALRYARYISKDVTAVYVATDPEDLLRVRRKWGEWGQGVRLVVLDSPYRLLIEPLLQYIEDVLSHRQPNEMVTIVVPQFVPRHWWNNLLHMNTANALRLALLFKPNVVITQVPYQVQ